MMMTTMKDSATSRDSNGVAGDSLFNAQTLSGCCQTASNSCSGSEETIIKSSAITRT